MIGKEINERYPVTNGMWKYVSYMSLCEYLESLGANPREKGFIKSHPKSFYLRTELSYKPGYKIDYDWDTGLSEIDRKILELRDSDPWHRKFKVFPVGSSVFGNDDYKYFALNATGLSSYNADGGNNCYVIVTTVAGNKVYCVDVLT
jgi:hypothetical protein